MITYDGLRVLMMAEDDSRCCFGLFGLLFQPYNVKIRQYACFFIARLMVMLPDVEISAKSKKITKNWILKSRIFQNRWKMDLNQVIYTVFHAEFESGSKIEPKPSQNQIFTIFSKIIFFMFFINLYRKGPWPPQKIDGFCYASK